MNVDVRLEPAPMRTVAGELGYGTGEGVRAEASWQHRNFINPEGALTVRGVAGTQEQLVSAEFRRSNFRRRDQVFDILALASNVDRDAYRAKTIQLSALIERQSNIIWRKKWTWSYGADLIATDERGIFDDPSTKETRTFLIAALPVSLRYDGSNDLLDPTTGFRLGGRLSPEISAHGGKFTYGRVQIDASAYRPVSDSVVVAGRIRVGTIMGAKASEIAPSRRFYSGGGGSVRGYGYQQLGPRDDFGDPIGGRGLAEFSLEARVRLKSFGGNFGIVPFIDGGIAHDRRDPGRPQLAVRRGNRCALSLQLRPDPAGRRNAAEPALRRCASRGRRLSRPGVLIVEDAISGPVVEQRRYRLKRHWTRRLLSELIAFFVVLMAPQSSVCIVLDTAPGHRFIVDRIGQLETASGLRFRIGRIEGSIFGETRLKNVAVLDQRGVFVTSPEIEVDWTPGRWLRNSLYLERIEADRLTLHRLPQLKPHRPRADRSCRSSTSISAN